MSTNTQTAKGHIPLLEKTAYGSGSLVNNLLPAALGVLMYFLITAFGMDPFLAGLLGGLPRIYDAITDPIMGYISDNTRSRYGRRRMYIFIGAVMSGLFFIILWQLDPADGQDYNFWYFLLFSLLYLTGNTIFATPLIALGYEMTSDYKERTRLMGFSQTIGQVAWMIVPWLWALIANPNLFPSQVVAVHRLSIITGAICILLGVLPAIFCKEPDSHEVSDRQKISLTSLLEVFKGMFSNIAKASKNGPFMRLCGATFLVFNGFQMVSSFAYFIIVFYLFNGDYGLTGNWPAWFSTISAIATAFLVIPVITWMANKWGKRQAFVISTLISIVGYIMKWWVFTPANPLLMFLCIPFMSFGIGGLFTLMMSMTADVCDLDELNNGLPRREGTFGAVYWWMVKLGQSLAMVLGGLVLKVVGFDQNAATQSMQTITDLRLADIIIPASTAFLAIVVMWKYNLTEERSKEISAELERRHRLQAEVVEGVDLGENIEGAAML